MILREVRLARAIPLHFPASSGGRSVRRKLEHLRARDGFTIEVTPLGLFLSAPNCPDQWVPTHLCVAGEVDCPPLDQRERLMAAIESGIAYVAQRQEEEQVAQQELPLPQQEAEGKPQPLTGKAGKGKTTPAPVKE